MTDAIARSGAATLLHEKRSPTNLINGPLILPEPHPKIWRARQYNSLRLIHHSHAATTERQLPSNSALKQND